MKLPQFFHQTNLKNINIKAKWKSKSENFSNQKFKKNFRYKMNLWMVSRILKEN